MVASSTFDSIVMDQSTSEDSRHVSLRNKVKINCMDSSHIKCTWLLLQSLTVPLIMEDVHMYVLPMALLEGASVMPDMNYWMMEFPVEVS